MRSPIYSVLVVDASPASTLKLLQRVHLAFIWTGDGDGLQSGGTSAVTPGEGILRSCRVVVQYPSAVSQPNAYADGSFRPYTQISLADMPVPGRGNSPLPHL